MHLADALILTLANLCIKIKKLEWERQPLSKFEHHGTFQTVIHRHGSSGFKCFVQ